MVDTVARDVTHIFESYYQLYLIVVSMAHYCSLVIRYFVLNIGNRQQH